ncbi:MAG: hypothetical protein M8353_01970 [ANME-2 cluster archaeon]|nr:hypothetical protein [ANME-2 cluster archaeon]
MRSNFFIVLTFLLIVFAANIDSSRALVEHDCRVCHSSNISYPHHLLVENKGFQCIECHPYRNGGVIKISDCLVCHPIPAEIDHGNNCTNCHLEGGTYATLNWNGSILSKSGFFNSSHNNITGDFDSSNYTQISKVCWGCHVDYADQRINPVHSNNVSQLPVCEDCHFDDLPLNKNNLRIDPIQIPEHQPSGEDIRTSISTNCTFCHNNSLSIPVPTTNVTHKTALNFVSHYLDTNNLVTPTNNTTECMWCHYKNFDNISWGKPTDPNNSSKFNHTFLNITNNSDCYSCHFSTSDLIGSFTFHDKRMTSGAGKDCSGCHDLDALTSVREKFRIDVSAMNTSDAIHVDLNKGAAVTVDENNARCWACHGEGDGSEASQPRGHPASVYNGNPRNCSNMDCHNVVQSIFNEPMVYEHFKYVDKIDQNISTTVDCPACHLNSVVFHRDKTIPSDTSLVSHYGSTSDLINTTSCIYCHLDEDHAEKWGNAPDPTDNISRFSKKKWEKKLYVGEKWYLGNRYFLVFEDIAADGGGAYLRLYRNDLILDDIVVDDAQNYTYETRIRDSGTSIKTTVFKLNVTAVFRSSKTEFVDVKASVWKRIHPEDNDTACWACHIDDYVIDRKKYLILDEDEDRIYYVEKLLDHSDEDTRDKEILFERDFSIGEGSNASLEIGRNFTLTAEEVDINSKRALMKLARAGSIVKEGVYKEGEYLEYEEDLSYDGHTINDVVTFSALIESVFHGPDSDAVIVSDVKVISGLMAIDNDEILGGYNTSQLHTSNVFSLGGIPDTFHVPSLNEGLDGGSDCVYCHDVSNGFGISSVNAIQTRLGGHSTLNAPLSNLTNDINRACWACHGEGVDPGRHPADYLYPRQCEDCHVNLENPTYRAVDISDEPHGQAEDCHRCHGADYPGQHVINVFEPLTPNIIKIETGSTEVVPGQQVDVKVTSMAGWNMKVRDIEYFIDIEGQPGTGISVMPNDGIFDEQIEEAEFTINTTRLEPGNHTVYVHSMERDNKWGPVNHIEFSIDRTANSAGRPFGLKIPLWALALIGLLLIGFTLIRQDKNPFKRSNILPGIIIIVFVMTGFGFISQWDEPLQFSSIREYQELNISGQECDECHIEASGYRSLEGRHADLKCVYCHPEHTYVEACINCHGPHRIHLIYENCLVCHPAHSPLDIDYTENVSNENCAACHERITTVLESSSTKHSTLLCTKCHSNHENIPECNSCHTPHAQNMTSTDCIECHPAHDPVVIEFPAGTRDGVCAVCHNAINSTLHESGTEHQELGCIYCHPEHDYLPDCESCHGLPHEKAIHETYPRCMQCHIVPHDVKNIVFTE